MSSRHRGIVISNCQAPLLANALTVLSKETIFEPWGVHLISEEDREFQIDKFIDHVKKKYDLVIAIPLSDQFFGLSSRNIARSFGEIPVLLISNIYFSGLHPDVTYLGVRGDRILSPLNDYHSRLVLWAFVNRLSESSAEMLFREEVYDKLGYFSAWESGIAEAQKRDAGLDVKVTDIWMPVLRSAVAFYTVNHPSPALVSPFAAKAISVLNHRGFVKPSGLRASPFLIDASLFSGAVFPVYPEIAAHHNVPSFGGYLFKPSGARVNPLALIDFIRESYRLYAKYPPDRIAKSEVVKAICRTFSPLLGDL